MMKRRLLLTTALTGVAFGARAALKDDVGNTSVVSPLTNLNTTFPLTVNGSAPGITLTSVPTTGTAGSGITIGFSYTVAAPSGLTAVWNPGVISGGVSGFSAAGGNGSATVTAPSSTGTYTLTVTGTGSNTASATAPNTTVISSGGGNPPIPSTSNRPQFNTGTNVLSWAGPVGGGPSNGTYTPQTRTLTNSAAITTTAANQVIQGLNIVGTGNGIVTIAHNGCTLKQCRVFDSTANQHDVVLVSVNQGISGTIIEDCLLDQNATNSDSASGGTSTIAGDQPAGPGVNGITARRNTCTRTEQAIRFILNNVSFTENLCIVISGQDADWFECYPVGGTNNNLTISYNLFDGGSGTAPGADSGINMTTGSGLPVGNIGPNITINSNWFTNWVGVHALVFDKSSGGLLTLQSFTNNGFFNCYSNFQPIGAAISGANSGNYTMATATSTSGALLNGTGAIALG